MTTMIDNSITAEGIKDTIANLNTVTLADVTEENLADTYCVINYNGVAKKILLTNLLNKSVARHHRAVLETSISVSGGISDRSVLSQVVNQGSGTYLILAELSFNAGSGACSCSMKIKVGDTYSTATLLKLGADEYSDSGTLVRSLCMFTAYDISNGSTVHLGAAVSGGGTCNIFGNASGHVGATTLALVKLDDHFGYW